MKYWTILKKRLRMFLTRSLRNPPKTKSGKRALVKLSYCAHLWIFPMVFVYYEILLRLFNGTGVFQHLIYPVLFGASLGLLLNAVCVMLAPKTSRIVMIAVFAVSGAMYATECLVYNSYQVYMSLSALIAGAGGVVTGFGDNLLRAIGSGILPILLFLLPAILVYFFQKQYAPIRAYKPGLACAALIVSLALFGIGTLAASTGATADMYKDQFDFDTATACFGLPTSLRLSTVRGGSSETETFTFEETEPQATAEPTSETTVAEAAGPTAYNQMDIDLDTLIATSKDENVVNISRYVQSLSATAKNEYTGLFEGKNLILICAEAFSDAVISPTLTPTLYRLAHNGFYFSNYYQPTWGGSTSTGEYSFLTGLVPTNGVNTIHDVQNNNMYFTLGNQLQRLGYYNAAFHNGTYDYYERNETHYNLGYGTWLAQNNGLEEIAYDYPTDDDMILSTLECYKDQQPFSIYYMTVCGHAPYNTSKSYVSSNGEYVLSHIDREYEKTTLCYLAYQFELEKALNLLVSTLELEGMADNTVICLTADHYPYGLADSGAWGNDQDYVADLYNDPDYADNPWTRDRNALIIWSGCLENENKDMACEISDVTYSLDIVPTLSNLFGLEYDSRLLVGRDVFSEAEPFAVWANGTFLTSVGGYNSKTGEFITWDSSPVDEEYVKQMKNVATNKIKFSNLVKSTDYYAVLFGEDTDTSSNEKDGVTVFEISGE